MGKAITLSTLRSDVRFAFDLVASSSRLTDAQLDRVINKARDKFFLFLVDCNETYLATHAVVTTTGGQEHAPLPSRFYKALSLRLEHSERSYPLRAATIDEIRYDFTPSQAWGSETLPVYWIAQERVYFWPIPNGAYTVDVAYLQGFADLTAPGDTWDVQPAWDEWVVLDALVQLTRRDKKTAGEHLAERDMLGQQIATAIANQDLGDPQYTRRIADSRIFYGRTCEEDA